MTSANRLEFRLLGINRTISARRVWPLRALALVWFLGTVTPTSLSRMAGAAFGAFLMYLLAAYLLASPIEDADGELPTEDRPDDPWTGG